MADRIKQIRVGTTPTETGTTYGIQSEVTDAMSISTSIFGGQASFDGSEDYMWKVANNGQLISTGHIYSIGRRVDSYYTIELGGKNKECNTISSMSSDTTLAGLQTKTEFTPERKSGTTTTCRLIPGCKYNLVLNYGYPEFKVNIDDLKDKLYNGQEMFIVFDNHTDNECTLKWDSSTTVSNCVLMGGIEDGEVTIQPQKYETMSIMLLNGTYFVCAGGLGIGGDINPPVTQPEPETIEIKGQIGVNINASAKLPLYSTNLSFDFSKTSDFAKKETITKTASKPASSYQVTLDATDINPLVSKLGLTKDDTLYYKVYVNGSTSGAIVADTTNYGDTQNVSVSKLTSSGVTIHQWYHAKVAMSADKTSISTQSGISHITIDYSYVQFWVKLGNNNTERGTRWTLNYTDDDVVDGSSIDKLGMGVSGDTGTVNFKVCTSNGTGADSINFMIGGTNNKLPLNTFVNGGITISTYNTTPPDYQYKLNINVSYSKGSSTGFDHLTDAYLDVTVVGYEPERYFIGLGEPHILNDRGSYEITHYFGGTSNNYNVTLTLGLPNNSGCSATLRRGVSNVNPSWPDTWSFNVENEGDLAIVNIELEIKG